ncbi:MAG: hypothetical protein QE263_02545 [Vampirovibrionales bacterium]|nr:hypothetical protein [Vampirovibrionales bacterium]
MDKLDWVDALTQRSLRGELSPQQDAALSANINNFIVTDDINPLKDAFERLSNKGDPIFLRFEETLHTDSLALQAVEKGHYTTERDPHAGYNILVTFPKPNSNLSVTKVYNYLPGDDDNDSP